jgi:serine phosphatase RsbU (regulator of sigma subunit)
VDEQERLVEKVLELNDELVGTHRELVRQRTAAEAGERRVAELLERERGIAETLQRALLPDRLPAVEGIELTAHFEPATGHVGGDWYDALELDSGELALAIGDVAGKGIPAAALMGELRGGLRAAILSGAEPSDALRVLDRLAQRAGHMATAVIVLLDPATGALRYATAGHLPPALIEPGGAVRFLTAGASTPLIVYDPKAGGATDQLDPGARLVLYTDGLVERRTEAIDESLRRLADAASIGGELAALPAHLLAALRPPEGITRDDIAIVAVQRTH